MNDSLGITDVIPGEKATSSTQDGVSESVPDLHRMGQNKGTKGGRAKAAAKTGQEPLEAMMHCSLYLDLHGCCMHG